MITKFDATQPVAASRVQSEPIRTNFLALNERSDQLTPAATSPVSTSVNIGNALNVYFEDNSYTPFTGTALDLGSSTGISNFNNPGTFKEVIIYFARDSFGVGQLGFLESAELSIRNHSVTTAAALINDLDAQRVPNGTTGVSETVPDAYNDISPLDDAVIVCSVIVTHNGQTGQRGAVSPIFDADIIDCRPFLQRTFSTKTIDAAVAAATTSVKVANSQVNLDDRVTTISASVVNSSTVVVTSPVVAASYNPGTLGYNPVIRISTNTLVNAASANGGTTFVTATITGVTGTTLTLSNPVTVTAGALVIRGQWTEDRLAFDLVNSFGSLMERDPSPTDPSVSSVRLAAPVELQNLSNGAVLKLESSSSDGHFGIRVPASLSGIVNTDWILPADEPAVGEVISVESLTSGVATLRWSNPSVTTLQTAYGNSVDGYIITSGGKGVFIDGTEGLTVNTTGGLTVTNGITGDLTGSATSFTGSLIGDVTGTQGATVVSFVGGKTSIEVKDTVDGYTALAPDIILNTTHRNTVTGNPHNVTIKDVDGYSTTEIDGYLSAKANSAHNHSASEITSGTLPIVRGGTGASTAATARSSLGIFSGTLAGVNSASATTTAALPFDPTLYNITVSWQTSSPTVLLGVLNITAKSSGPNNFSVQSLSGAGTGIIAWIAVEI